MREVGKTRTAGARRCQTWHEGPLEARHLLSATAGTPAIVDPGPRGVANVDWIAPSITFTNDTRFATSIKVNYLGRYAFTVAPVQSLDCTPVNRSRPRW